MCLSFIEITYESPRRYAYNHNWCHVALRHSLNILLDLSTNNKMKEARSGHELSRLIADWQA